MNTKKILLYGGGALVIGALSFFVWSFFKKEDLPLVIDSSSQLPEETSTNPFSSMPTTFESIKEPNVLSDLDGLM